MIVQESKEGITVRIEVIGLDVGMTEKQTVGVVALWLIGFLSGSHSLRLDARHAFNNEVRRLLLLVADEVRFTWQSLRSR